MDKYQEILKQYWGYDDFRGIQREIIDSIGAGHDTLGLMPTGGGKSITFQVPALSVPGVCLVVTPLISLMKDQVDNLRRRGITAYAIYSGLSHNEIVCILDNCIYGDIKFLYVSPERLSTSLFQNKIRHMKISFIAVDEAHCISQWGYDFRPAYLRIADLRKLLPDKPILALTATATPAVVKDIQHQLGFREGSNVFRMSFRRQNVSYIVRQTQDVHAEILHIISRVEGSAIIYTMSRKRTKEVCQFLTLQGISADFYHAGLDTAVKTKRQQDWQEGRTRIIVATNAFGMGIDKPDVRLVIHADVPSSIEAYFQEAGRAGRDGARSYAVLLATPHTSSVLKTRLRRSFPSKEFIRNVYEHLAYFYEIGIGMGADHSFVFPIQQFCIQNRYNASETDAALRILTNAGYISYNPDPDDHTRVTFVVPRDALYSCSELTAEEDNLIAEMMRLYTGLFSNYVWIEERLLADRLGVDPERIYMLLTSLRRKQIIKFVPPRNEPMLTYLIDRVPREDVRLGSDVYDSLQEVMDEHINSVIDYIANTEYCRQNQLVRYFGEDYGEDCGCCEVCIERKGQKKDEATVGQAIADLLADHQRHLITELNALPFSKDDVSKALYDMVEDGKVAMDSFFVYAT